MILDWGRLFISFTDLSCSYHSKHIVIIVLQVIVQVIAYRNIVICYNLNVFQGLLCRLRSRVVFFCVFIQYRMVDKFQNLYNIIILIDE